MIWKIMKSEVRNGLFYDPEKLFWVEEDLVNAPQIDFDGRINYKIGFTDSEIELTGL